MQIDKLVTEIDVMITNNIEIVEKYERIRLLYKKLDQENKDKIYPKILTTYKKLQNSLNDIKNLTN